MKRRNIFNPLTGVKAKNTHVSLTAHSKNERWLFGVLSADDEAPTVEDEKTSRRYYIFFGIMTVLLFVLFSRAFYLQIVKGSESLTLAQENRFREQVIRAPRGLFFDRNRIPLVKNIPNYEVTVIPNDLPKDEKERAVIYNRLAKTIKMKASEIKKKAESKDLNYLQPILIAKSVSRDKSLVFESRQSELRGFYVGINPIRKYLDDNYFSHVFGYVGRISEEELKDHPDYYMTDYIGKSGLEESYEGLIRGMPGSQKVEVDSTGKVIRVYDEESPILGDNLLLTLDFKLQKKLTENLEKQMHKAHVEKGAAIALNPQNGEVLAFVSLPTFNNNLFAKGISDKDYKSLVDDENSPLLNRITSGEYPSGSIIKPYIASAGLEEGTITKSSTVNSTGGIKIGTWTFPDWRSGGHGVTNVIKAIAQSVNTFFYAVGGGYQNIKGLGPDLMKKYLERFGFGSAPALDIGGSASGHIPSPKWKEEVVGEAWYLGDTYHMAIGQGDVLVTPLQMANALMSIANGGTMYKMHFVKSVLDADGNVKSEKSAEVIKKGFISHKTIDIVREGMRETVVSGSGSALSSLSVTSAGKTGTAQYGSRNEKKHAWFTCFAPYENPKIEMVVLLEGAGEGSDFAVPVANDTLKWYFSKK